jgi:hypothetical protein
MTSIQNKLQSKKEQFSNLSTLEVILIVMNEVEKISYISGSEKEEYCIELIINYCHLNIDPSGVSDTIKHIVDITKGKYAINKIKTNFLGCF